jgi:hypothetical protein
VYRVLVAWLELERIETGDTHSETGSPARLPPRLLDDGDTLIEIVYGEDKNIFMLGRIKISCTRHDESTREGPPSFALPKSPFA